MMDFPRIDNVLLKWLCVSTPLRTACSEPVVVRVEILLDRRASADQVTVAVGLVDAADRGPDLASQHDPVGWIASLLSGVAVVPLVGDQVAQSVRRVLEHIIFFVNLATLNFCDFCPNLLESIDEAIDFELVL